MLHPHVYKLNHLMDLYANVLKTYCFIGSAHAPHVQLAGSAYIAYAPWATYHGYATTMLLSRTLQLARQTQKCLIYNCGICCIENCSY